MNSKKFLIHVSLETNLRIKGYVSEEIAWAAASDIHIRQLIIQTYPAKFDLVFLVWWMLIEGKHNIN